MIQKWLHKSIIVNENRTYQTESSLGHSVTRSSPETGSMWSILSTGLPIHRQFLSSEYIWPVLCFNRAVTVQIIRRIDYVQLLTASFPSSVPDYCHRSRHSLYSSKSWEQISMSGYHYLHWIQANERNTPSIEQQEKKASSLLGMIMATALRLQLHPSTEQVI